MAAPTTVVERVKQLGTRNAIAADPRFAGIVENVFPLTGQLGNTRSRIRTLGEGSYGRVNLEEVPAGQIAAKYFTDPRNFEDNVSELAVLKDLQDLPYVAQLVGVNTQPAALAVNAIAPPPVVAPLNFPVALMGKAMSDLTNRSLYTSWNDLETTCIQILKGMAVLHNQGIVHRDLKPQNMLMTSAKEVWISDFGRAKYTAPSLLPTVELYTGTYWYSAPELLMKSLLGKEDGADYIKSDMWAIGVVLYYILTGDNLFAYNSRTHILEAMYIRAGFPRAADGVTYDLFDEMDTLGILGLRYALPSYDYKPHPYKDRVLARTLFPPADPARLETFANVIQALMSYNPDNRPTALEALHTITGEDYAVPPRRSLLDEYVHARPTPPGMDSYQYNTFAILQAALEKINKLEIPFMLDRILIYVRRYYELYPGIISNKVVYVAMAIADALFDSTNGYHSFSLRDIPSALHVPFGRAIMAELNTILQNFMKSDIQYLGKTFYDDLIEGITDETKRQTLGILNFLCHQYNIFRMYVGNLDVLKQRILTFAADPANIAEREYFRRRIAIGAGTPANPAKPWVTLFLNTVRAPIPPPAGGKRRRMSRRKSKKSKRKTRARKH